ncbi:response regulator transcription factor [Microbacterium sp. CJ88]|uniref:response regulator transcription factor n=1 Tax=Microbacterium sp. CJ88 TaxID=3445672 RepID=UPI003F65754C
MRSSPASTSHDRPTAVVIERDAADAAALSTALARQGFMVTEAYDGYDGLDAVILHRPELITIEADLPGMDGFETVRRIRQISDAVIVILTTDSAETAIVEGFRSGADDYVLKPIGPFALRARIEAHMRRARANAPTAPAAEAAWLEHGPIQLHTASRRAHIGGRDRGLTRSEFDILSTLMRAKDQVFSKTQLALVLRDSNGLTGQHITNHDRHAVEVHVMNLRRKLADGPRDPQWIETVRGLGYRLAPVSDQQIAGIFTPMSARPVLTAV